MKKRAKTEWIEQCGKGNTHAQSILRLSDLPPYTAHLCGILCMTRPMHRKRTEGPLDETVATCH